MHAYIPRWAHVALVTGALALAVIARATPIDSAYLIGTAQGLPNSNPSSELSAATDLVNLYNSAGVPLLLSGATYTLNAGANVPAPDLPDGLTAASSNVSLSMVSESVNDGTGNTYLMMKAATTWALYYIGGLDGWQTLTNDVIRNQAGRAQGMSHYILFAATPGTNVPDGGSTALLLGGGLLATAAALRRRRHA